MEAQYLQLLQWLRRGSFNNETEHSSYLAKITSNLGENKEWLIPNKMILDKEDRKVVISIMEKLKNKKVVVKISHMDFIKKEFYMGRLLQSLNTNNYMDYYYYFQCNDSLNRYTKNSNLPNRFCNTGKNTYFIIAEYLEMGNLGSNKLNKSQLKSVIQQVLIASYLAYCKYGFMHNDLHLENILLRKTTEKNKKYDALVISTNGIEPVITDYDRSQFDSNKQSFYMFVMDVSIFTNLLSRSYPKIESLQKIHRDLSVIQTPQKYVKFVHAITI